MVWHAPQDFARTQGYQIVLVRRDLAAILRRNYLRGLWSGERPLRTLLWPFKVMKSSGPELKLRVFRFDKDLKMLLEAGPSLTDRQVLLRIMREDGQRAPLFFKLSGPSQVVTVPLDQLAVPGETSMDIEFEMDVDFSKRLMPYDDRLLVFRLDDCELRGKRDDPYSAFMLQALHGKWMSSSDATDVVAPQLSSRVVLGVGWYTKETDQGEPFRWMGDGAEIVIDGTAMEPRDLKITGQVGPSSPSGRLSVSAELNGVPFADLSVVNVPHGRATIFLDCENLAFKQAWRKGQNVIRLLTRGGNKPLAGDPRFLNFRVFQINETEVSSVPRAYNGVY